MAVLTVMLWHYQSIIIEMPRSATILKSGHLGVDLFFVLSGFLITTLMLNEHQNSGKISFPGFYRRRAFRLLPALVLFLAVHIVFAFLTDMPTSLLDPERGLRDEFASVLSVLFFCLNLLPFFGDYQVTLGLGHLWSLSVEEQFYLVWPFLIVALISRAAPPYLCMAIITSLLVVSTGHALVWNELGENARFGLSVVAGLTVAIFLMSVRHQTLEVRALSVLVILVLCVVILRIGLFDGSLIVSLRLYSSLISRADSLIVGAVLALLWVSGRIPYRCPSIVSVIAWVLFGWFVTTFTLGDPFFYLGGWTAVALCAALTIWGCLGSEETIYGRSFTMGWLRAIGKVSYGLYIWHLFVFQAVQHWYGAESIALKTILALGVTAGVTTASWVWVERPALAYKRARKTA